MTAFEAVWNLFEWPAERFDYERQAWVKDGQYVRCGHPESMECGCYGREHAGEAAVTS